MSAESEPLPQFLADLDECVNCGTTLARYRMGPSGRERRGTDLVAIIEHDRVTRWRCPACAHEWPRGTVVFADGRVGPARFVYPEGTP
jgi:hypothetical protein